MFENVSYESLLIEIVIVVDDNLLKKFANPTFYKKNNNKSSSVKPQATKNLLPKAPIKMPECHALAENH